MVQTGHRMQLIEVAAPQAKKVSKPNYEAKPLSADAIRKAKFQASLMDRPSEPSSAPSTPPSGGTAAVVAAAAGPILPNPAQLPPHADLPIATTSSTHPPSPPRPPATTHRAPQVPGSPQRPSSPPRDQDPTASMPMEVSRELTTIFLAYL